MNKKKLYYFFGCFQKDKQQKQMLFRARSIWLRFSNQITKVYNFFNNLKNPKKDIKFYKF